jgi:hypothetical protein
VIAPYWIGRAFAAAQEPPTRRTHAHTHARTHARARALSLSLSLSLSLFSFVGLTRLNRHPRTRGWISHLTSTPPPQVVLCVTRAALRMWCLLQGRFKKLDSTASKCLWCAVGLMQPKSSTADPAAPGRWGAQGRWPGCDGGSPRLLQQVGCGVVGVVATGGGDGRRRSRPPAKGGGGAAHASPRCTKRQRYTLSNTGDARPTTRAVPGAGGAIGSLDRALGKRLF